MAGYSSAGGVREGDVLLALDGAELHGVAHLGVIQRLSRSINPAAADRRTFTARPALLRSWVVFKLPSRLE